MARQDVAVQLFYDGVWNDHTDSARIRTPIQITRGRGDEQSALTPSTCQLALDNRDGTFNPSNPSSSLFGKIGRNTPLRVAVGPLSVLSLPGGSGNYASSPDAASLDITGDIDIRAHIAPTDWTPAADRCVVSKSNTTGNQRSYQLVLQTPGNLRFTWSTDGTSAGATNADSTVATGFTDGTAHWVRVTLAVATGTVTFYTSANGEDWTQLGAKVTVGATSIFAGTATANVGARSAGTTDVFTGSIYWVQIRSGIDGVIVANPRFDRQTASDTSFVDSTGKTWTINGTAVILDLADSSRFSGEVSSWKPRRELGGDAWTEVTASGILRRLGQGAKALQSPLYRLSVREPTVAAYWPLENVAPNPVLLPSPVAGCPSATIRNSGSVVIQPVTWSDEDSLVGSSPLGALDTENGVAGVEATLTVAPGPALGVSYWTRTDVPPKDLSNGCFTQTTFTLFLKGSSVPRFTATLLQFPPGSSLALDPDTGSVTVRGSSADNTGASIDTVAADIDFVDGWRHVFTYFEPDGADVAVTIFVDNEPVAFGTLPSTTMGDVSAMRLGVFTQDTTTEQVGRVSFGHPAILTGSTTDLEDAAARIFDAGYGHSGEAADDRIDRLCTEEGIELVRFVGTSVEAMGPQPVAELVEILAECERTDAGVMVEPNYFLGLVYYTHDVLYNQVAALGLDFEAGQIRAPLDPDIDDLNVRNDVTAQRREGGSARAVRESGPLNTGDPAVDADAVGVYDTTIDVNPETDAQLANIAGWYLSLGTVDETRYSRVTVDLDAAPDLVEAVQQVDIGSVLTIGNLPDQPDPAELLVVGITETIETHRRLVTFNCVPASPYRVFTLGQSRLASGGSTLTNAETSGSTAFELTTQSGSARWSTTDEPYDLVVAGERVTVTTNNDTTSPQDVTVTRSVNGVVKAHAAGEAVQIFQPAVLGL